MAKFIYIPLLMIFAVILALYFLALQSKRGEAPGLSEGKLVRCSKKPNCVCSEFSQSEKHTVEAIDFDRSHLELVKKAVLAIGGNLRQESDQYWAFTFSSSFFGFIDDLEIRYDDNSKKLHFRSSSRVGHSDLGANRKRVELLKEKVIQLLAESE